MSPRPDRYAIYDFNDPAPRSALAKTATLAQGEIELRRLGRGEIVDFWRLPSTRRIGAKA